MPDRVPRNVQRQAFSDRDRIILAEQDIDTILDIGDRMQASIGKLLTTAVMLLVSVCTTCIVLVLNLIVGR